MTANEYQEGTRVTAIYPKHVGDPAIQRLTYPVLGLASEAGELAGKLKKALRDDQCITADRYKQLFDELGDVMWYVARIADEVGFSLDDVMQNNMTKLLSRKDRGVLGGSGDNR